MNSCVWTSHRQSIQHLPGFLRAIKDSNPDTCTHLDISHNRSDQLFVCPVISYLIRGVLYPPAVYQCTAGLAKQIAYITWWRCAPQCLCTIFQLNQFSYGEKREDSKPRSLQLVHTTTVKHAFVAETKSVADSAILCLLQLSADAWVLSYFNGRSIHACPSSSSERGVNRSSTPARKLYENLFTETQLSKSSGSYRWYRAWNDDSAGKKKEDLWRKG